MIQDRKKMTSKQELRKEIKRLNKEWLTPNYRSQASECIVQRLLNLNELKEAKHVALFHALPDEPDLAALLAKLSKEKSLYLPRVEGEFLSFYKYTDEAGLCPGGAFGISEPTAHTSEAVDPALLDLILVPGLAFDKNGNRLGRGKAFYDKFLPQTKAKLVGVVFKYRSLDEVPTDPWDRPMDLLVTD